MPYRSRWSKELDLEQGELVQVLLKEDQNWWFGRLTNGHEGFFPAACVEPLVCTASPGSAGSTDLSEVLSTIFLIITNKIGSFSHFVSRADICDVYRAFIKKNKKFLSECKDLCIAGWSYFQSHAHIAEEGLSASCNNSTFPLWLHQVPTSTPWIHVASWWLPT